MRLRKPKKDAPPDAPDPVEHSADSEVVSGCVVVETLKWLEESSVSSTSNEWHV